MTDVIERLDGTCPTCEGEASVYPSPTDDGRGHVYCAEENCGWIHRDKPDVGRFIDTGMERQEDTDE